jgi:DNA-directed RNA polymerase subunit RPC12/RpoP
MTAFECECGEPLTATAEQGGRTVRCPCCGAAVVVRESGYAFEPDALDPVRGTDPAAEGRHQARRVMTKAHADLDEDEAKRAREWRPVVFTPGLVGGLAVFVVCSLLAVGSLLLYNLYLAIGLLVFAVLGLIRAALSFFGRGVD